MRVFLSGPMGAGKSTVAGAVADRLGTTAIDLDERVEALAEKTIPQIFAEQGEGAFRALEKRALAELSADVGVVALGGGTTVDDDTRQSLLQAGILVTLTASPSTLAERIGAGTSRPLLGADPEADLARIIEARAPAYAEAHAVIDTEAFNLDRIAAEVVAVRDRAPIVVPLGLRTYRVEVGRGVRHRVGSRAVEHAAGDAILVFDGDEDRGWPKEAIDDLTAVGKPPIEVQLPGDEVSKNIVSVEKIWDTALEAEVDRRAIVIGVGGGVIGDLAAFAASTLLRGVALGQVPTTLLSMVDSSVGGKTGFNRARGKNLIGTFYQPKFVLCDIDTLSTLPTEERTSGLAEVVKSAWLDSEESVAMLERDADALLEGDPDATIRAVRMSVMLKSRIVHQDEREAGRRMLLNLGHTVCHGLEAASDYQGLRHGEGVALGMIAAMRVAAKLKGGRAQETERLSELLRRLGLPIDLDRRLDERVLGFIGSDKKRRGTQIHFVIPRLPGQTEIAIIGLDEVRNALRQG
ncbi:MAG: 3-dehydroquinate synthase [Myxococcales bacterium]|nr:3-dehydroquinate synthase [Myxococcales bacterium]MDH3483571.1 3-dehydroquinate synthase [Myxococcales bacterium]